MPAPTIALISTGLSLAVELSNKARSIVPPECRVINIVDDSIVSVIEKESDEKENCVLPLSITRRICDYAVYAECSGADVILVTCSSISEAVDVASKLVKVPVLKIDEPMIEEALTKGVRIGVVATLPTTLGPTVRLLKRKADESGRKVEVKSVLVQGAFKLLSDGGKEEHNSLVRKAIGKLEMSTECIILAQASMAQAIERFHTKVPVLTSFPSGLKVACDLFLSRTQLKNNSQTESALDK